MTPMGRVLASVNANGFATTQVYDAVGQRVAIIDARGNRTSFTWDADGRQIRHRRCARQPDHLPVRRREQAQCFGSTAAAC